MLKQNQKHPSRQALAVLIVLILTALSCALPLGELTPTPAASATETVPPTATLPVVSTVVITPVQPTPVIPTATKAPPPSTQTPASPEVSDILIFMVAMEDNGASGPAIGCGDSLIPVRRTITPTRQPLRAALDLLLAQKSQFYGESGLYNALYQSNLTVQSAEIGTGGAASVALVGQVQLGGVCDVPRFKGQIEQTILSISGVQAASILLNGVPIDQALSQR